MTDPVDQPAKPPRTWRPMAAWTGAILLALGLAWFVGAVAVPVWQVRREIPPEDFRCVWAPGGSKEAVVERLGGPEAALRKINVYLHMPPAVAPDQWLVIDLLYECGERAKPVLIRETRSRDPERRLMAVSELANWIPDDASLLPVMLGALNDPHDGVRSAAIYGLGRATGAAAKDVVPELKKVLSDKDEAMRFQAARALSRVDPSVQDGVPTLIWGLSGGADLGWSCEALARIGPGAVEAVPALVKKLDDCDSSNGWLLDILTTLRQVAPGTKTAVPALIRKLENHGQHWFGAEICQALGEAGPAAKEAVPALVITAHSLDERIRLEAVKALGAIGPEAKEAIPTMEKFLSDKSEPVRSAAAEALRKIRREEAEK